MSFLDDLDAISTWTRHDQGASGGGPGHVYICRDCAWRDRGGALAFAHQRATGHRVRGRDWPTDWPDAAGPTGRTA